MKPPVDDAHVSFVVVAYRNDDDELRDLCTQLLDSAEAQGLVSDVQLVVNDDHTPKVLPSQVNVLRGHGNVGFARGVSLGVSSSSSQFVIVINPDCHPTRPMLGKFLDALSPGCGILVPQLLNDSGELDYFAYQNWTFTPGRKWSERRCARDLHRLPGGPLPTWAKAPGAFLGMERAVAERFGPFDDAFFLYAEDRDLTDRARAAGVPINYLPDVQIGHSGGASGGTVQPLVAEAKADGYLRIASRRYGRLGVALASMDLWCLAVLNKVRNQPNHWNRVGSVVKRWLRGAAVEQGRLITVGRPAEVRGAVRALALWSDNSAANLGLRVLAQGTSQLMSSVSADAHVDFQDFGPGDSPVSFGTRAIARDLWSRRPITAKLRNYNLVIDTGAGDSFTDIYGLKRLTFIAYAHWRCRRLGIPVVFGPQTIGPFRTRLGRTIAARSVAQAHFIFARDQASADYCSLTFGRPVDAVTTDLVFTLQDEISPIPHDVLLNVSGLLWFGDDHGPSSHYREQTISLIRQLHLDGRDVALLGHVVHSPSGHDDLDAIQELQEILGKEDVCAVVDPTDLEDARRHIAGARVLIGARMHACLNALSQGVPAIAWAYSRKFEPLLQAVGWSHVIDLRSASDPAARTVAMLASEEQLQDEASRVAQSARAIMTPAVAKLRESLTPVLPVGSVERP